MNWVLKKKILSFSKRHTKKSESYSAKQILCLTGAYYYVFYSLATYGKPFHASAGWRILTRLGPLPSQGWSASCPKVGWGGPYQATTETWFDFMGKERAQKRVLSRLDTYNSGRLLHVVTVDVRCQSVFGEGRSHSNPLHERRKNHVGTFVNQFLRINCATMLQICM